MPISIDEFEDRSPEQGSTNAERVLRFLARNRDQAFRAAELSEATGVSQNSIHPVLRRLEDRDLVRHREPYWAVGDLDAVRDAAMFQSAAAFLDDELGPESREEWLDAARTGESEE